jgi:hypothetical protein
MMAARKGMAAAIVTIIDGNRAAAANASVAGPQRRPVKSASAAYAIRAERLTAKATMTKSRFD